MNMPESEQAKALQSLQHRYRVLLGVNLVVSVVLVASCLSSAARSPSEEVVRARAFVLVDESGQELGRFACENGMPGLGMWDAAGSTRVGLGLGVEKFGHLSVNLGGPPGDATWNSFLTGSAIPTQSVGALVMSAMGGNGVTSSLEMKTSGSDNRWDATHADSEGGESTLFMHNNSDYTLMYLDADKDESWTIITLASSPEAAVVSVSDDTESTVELRQEDGQSSVDLSNSDRPGYELRIDRSEDGASIKVTDAKGAEVARFPK